MSPGSPPATERKQNKQPERRFEINCERNETKTKSDRLRPAYVTSSNLEQNRAETRETRPLLIAFYWSMNNTSCFFSAPPFLCFHFYYQCKLYLSIFQKCSSLRNICYNIDSSICMATPIFFLMPSERKQQPN